MKIALGQLIDSLPGLVWTALADGRAEFVNQRWCDYTGLSAAQASGHGWLTAIHPEDADLVLESWRSQLDAGRSGEVEARLRRHDGRYRRFLFRASPITDDSGRIVQWCGINIDIEERLRAAEDAKAASEAELKRAHRSLVDAQRLSLTGSYSADLLADEHLWSDELYRIFELEPGARVIVSQLKEMVHPEDRPSFDIVMNRAIAGGADPDHGYRIITPSGKLKHLRSVGHKVLDREGRMLIVGAIQDVTERKLAEEAVEAGEAELRAMLGHLAEAQRLSKTGSFSADMLKDEHFWSEECYRICEMDPGLQIKTQTILNMIHPEDVPAFQEAVTAALAGKVTEFTYRIVTLRGAVKQLRGVARRIDNDSGQAMILGAVQDVTESKSIEDALNEARTELAHLARVMTLSALTASMAHEVNQPLCGIMASAETCLRRLETDPPQIDNARKAAQRILRDGERATGVIQRLRAMFARKQPLMEPVDLNGASREVLALLSSQLQRNRVVIRTELPEHLPSARGDRVQLQQVILNLILNAADAMMAVDDRPRELHLSTACEDRWVRLSVRDSGTGLDPQQIDRLFDAFYTTKSQGMGVGLSISRSIIEGHGGRLWASPNNGHGATFAFSIPGEPGAVSAGIGLSGVEIDTKG